ncbi:MAG: Teichoic acid biosynthesis protein [Parcubacteria group bacterium GW2011_GWE2_39_37]|uniref:Teichoic acid biosynthesis protein n=1 Tax=Candidatus Falkowbacteria bacterium GW2011_GWF2_39_8 TaxID=1618642 RepID=A0A0G0PT30_9BACT|nr:MAG: Teichoic acid biosynthesis protein [Parcubacteria group bacterium GW2011_GWE2_39_37]KKR31324.1 MAG: Teichoic acid biosynthesis protein [Candidatus Falkowbacteria bacterium GW2011_GWF2_39_8]
MNKINILGINISQISKKEVLVKIEAFLKSKKQHYIVTPNPEIILMAEKDEEYFYILNNADISIMDGFGLKVAAWFSGENVTRITGADLTTDILKFASAIKKRVVIFNWSGGLSTSLEIRNSIEKKFPGLSFQVLDLEKNQVDFEIDKINLFSPEIALVALGAPWQEKFINHNLKNLPSVKVAIGIGGAIDFITGKAKRAPKSFRFFGLEWLWRAFQQKRIPGKKVFFFDRFKRVYRAVFVFSWKFFVWRFILPFFYRKNVACLLYKKEDDKYKVLIVERVWQKEHWQLPQGGTECENIMEAGARELREELNTDNFKPIAGFSNLWKYKFKKYVGSGKYLADKHWGYKGQAQGLFIAEFLGEDKDIRLNYWDHVAWKWVLVEDLVKEVYSTRRESTQVFLNKFLEVIKNHEIEN